jgi:hypothetical protein
MTEQPFSSPWRCAADLSAAVEDAVLARARQGPPRPIVDLLNRGFSVEVAARKDMTPKWNRRQMAPQRLEKIESAPGNGMGSEASNPQDLVHRRAARLPLTSRENDGAKFSAPQSIENARNAERISIYASPFLRAGGTACADAEARRAAGAEGAGRLHVHCARGSKRPGERCRKRRPIS